jgi:predicted NAD/FAD-binding protein
MRIAVIGTGIAGNVAAYHLSREHDVTVYESNRYVGGHTHTHDVFYQGNHYTVDTGFIVFNYRTYPNFVKLLTELGVQARPSHMGFGVKCERSGLEYNGSGLNGLFAQRRNLLRPRFYQMIRDILRFNREAPLMLEQPGNSISLGQYLDIHGYSDTFINNYLIPMGAAIWSASHETMLAFPAAYFLRFFHNHGLLTVSDQPQWYVIEGGSRSYVDPLIRPYRDNIRLNTPVVKIERMNDRIDVTDNHGHRAAYDRVFLACHSDQALRMIHNPTAAEREVLGAIRYQANDAVLHTDTRLLPLRRAAWAAWNYLIPARQHERAAVTYNMNILQGIEAPVTFCVTLNSPVPINEQNIIAQMRYEHPVYTPDAIAAQQRHGEINGADRLYFCGAYWRYGFHEDGVVSALNALQHFKDNEQHAQLHLRRAG